MAKGVNRYLISYSELIRTLQGASLPNNILLHLREKVLLDDIVKVIAASFIGEKFNINSNYIAFNAEDKMMENVLNECSNIGLFSEKKIVVLRNVKKLVKNERLALLDYLGRFNTETILIMTSYDEELDIDKVFFLDSKEDHYKEYKATVSAQVRVFALEEFSENEMIDWIRKKFGDYKISDDTIRLLIEYSNYSFDEILCEVEKLKTYCYFTKEIRKDSIKICNGISKDFNETDFIKAVLSRDKNSALKIYDQITLKKDVEVYLVFLLTSAFIIINKLFDPATSKLQGFFLKKELKLWFADQEMLLPFYNQYKNSINTEKLRFAFEYIYATDKILKSSGTEKKTTMAWLINNICNL